MEVNIRKRLGEFTLDVHFKAEKSRLGILGASGSGKSMTLKCIAGIATPDEGRIEVNGRVLFDSEKRINLKPRHRKVGYLFQDYALFPTFTTYDNIASGLKCGKKQKREIVSDLVNRFQLEGLEKHYPHQLSGGQQQRTAFARIVACEPDMILLDEPFSALDSHLRDQMQKETREILSNYDNSVMVTHNRDEAYKLCTDLLILDSGRVVVSGKTGQLFENPGTVKAAKLTGCKNVSRVKRVGEYELRALDWGGLHIKTKTPVGDKISHIGVRAHTFVPLFTKDERAVNVFRISVTDSIAAPFEMQVIFKNAEALDLDSQSDLYWECDKNAVSSMPEYLCIPPESLLLLTDD